MLTFNLPEGKYRWIGFDGYTYRNKSGNLVLTGRDGSVDVNQIDKYRTLLCYRALFGGRITLEKSNA